MKKVFLLLFLVFGGYNLIAQAPNDECVNRETIIVNTSELLEYTIDTSTATESIDTSCENPATDNLDVWYEFTMPVNGNLRISDIPSTIGVTLFDSCGGSEIACFFNDGFIFDLVASTTYVLRISENAIFASPVNFNIQAFETAPNDECADRELITVTTAAETTVSFDTSSATESIDTSCENPATDNLDVWYEFTMPVNGNLRISDIPSTIGVTLFDSCGGSEIACFFNDGFIFDLVASTTYVLRISENAIFASPVNFNIQAFETAPNDECADRELITVTTAAETTVSFDTSSATESIDTSCENPATDNLDVWYEFTMPVNGNLRISDIPSTIGVTLFDSCGGSEIACFFNDGFIFDLVASTTYVLRISENMVFASPVNFNIQAFETAINDDCETPIEIVVLQETTTTIALDNRSASESIDASCDIASLDNLDVWYSFTMPVNGTIEITNVANTESFSLFEECDGEEIGCFFNDGSFFELINGNTYLLRTSTRSVFSGLYDFTIQAIEVAPQPCSDSTIWDGSSWSNGVPDNTKSALFNGNYNTDNTEESVNACSVTIASGNTVTIGDGYYLRSVFDITVEGSLQVSNAGSVVQVAEDAVTINNGSIEISKTTPSLEPRDFILLSSPMSLEVNGEVYGSADRVFGIIEENFVPNTDSGLDTVVANFIDDNGDYLDNLSIDNPNLPDDASGSATPIVPGTGYLVFPQAVNNTGAVNYDHDYTQGTLNSGVIERVTTYNGPTTENNFNLLGNPYASAIDVNQFIMDNDPVNEVYYWEHITEPDSSFPGFNTQNFTMDDVSVRNLMGGIASQNGDTDPGQFMSSGQGFAILANQAFAGTNISFNNSMRVIGNNETLRSSEQDNKLWLEMTSNIYTISSRTLIGFVPEGSPAMDLGYDSGRLDTSINLFSVLDDGHQLSIQSREIFNPDMEIALGFNNALPEDLQLTISISQIEGAALEQSDIYLIDKLLNTVTDLKATDYSFTSGEGIQENRFTLVFREAAVLDVEEESFRESNISLYPNPASDSITLDYRGNEPLIQLTIVNVNGQIMLRKDLSDFNGQQQINIEDLSAGMYFVNLESTQNTITKKLIIK